MAERAIVVGASSGIGLEIARQLAASGAQVAAVARRSDALSQLAAEFPGQIRAYSHDVTDYDAVPGVFAQITQDLGGLDLLVYSSGVMARVEPDEFDFAKDRPMIEVNVLGAIAWIDQAAVRFQNVGAGTILGIGSLAGERGRRSNPVYNASKAALHTYLESVRNRLSERGVCVVTVKPGPVETPMTAGMKLPGMMSAPEAARRILALRHKQGEHTLVLAHRVIFFVIRHLPGSIMRRLKKL